MAQDPTKDVCRDVLASLQLLQVRFRWDLNYLLKIQIWGA